MWNKPKLNVKHFQELTKSTELSSIIGDGDCVEFEEVFPFPNVPFYHKKMYHIDGKQLHVLYI